MSLDDVLRSKSHQLIFFEEARPALGLGGRRLFEGLERDLAAANANKIEQLRDSQTLSNIRTCRQKEWDNRENRGFQKWETSDSLGLGGVIRSQDAVNIISQIRGDQNVGNREDGNDSKCNSHTSQHGED
jgi:hypothetical protein